MTIISRLFRGLNGAHISDTSFSSYSSQPYNVYHLRTASLGSNASAIALLVFLQVLAGVYRDVVARDALSVLAIPARLAAIDAFKLAFSFALYFLRVSRPPDYHNTARSSAGQLWHLEETEQQHLADLSLNEDGSAADEHNQSYRPVSVPGTSIFLGTTRLKFALGFLSMLYSIKAYFALSTSKLADPMTLHLSTTPVALFSAFLLFSFLSRPVPALQWYAIFLQICGLFIAQNTSFLPHLPESSYCIVFVLSLYSSLVFVLNEQLYKVYINRSIQSFNIVLFASGFALHSLIFLLRVVFGSSTQSLPLANFSIINLTSLLIHAAVEVTCINVIFQYDAIVLGVASSFSSTILMLLSRGIHRQVSFTVMLGAFLAVMAFVLYMKQRQQPDFQEGPELTATSRKMLIPGRRLIGGMVTIIMLLAYAGFTVFRDGVQQRIFKPTVPPVFADLSYLPPASPPTCRRQDLASIEYYPRQRTYHEFDDVLLIVFFSHARYDVNLEYYKNVYSEFFPNMVFIGPASREDAGFSGSYDVIVDSYESDEDLSNPRFYKMAGRMAHHMLYTAMKDYDCYEGYLWAPFDTLLNVPRLQQFRKDRFWYHSPFGEYVPNPAMGDNWDNKSMHPPPLNISPDPMLNLTETYRGWQQDWWWGEPHVGLEVCMRAFRQVPEELRLRLASFTNGTTRLLGGSADTLYIPGQLRVDFLDILGIFLETDCFLEIAVPTVVHLVVPKNEPILFIDHWWIWMPPFNATFVREKWEDGLEVDTFHTFHWGDTDADGIWRGIPKNVAEVRQLLTESAVRQGVMIS